MAQDQVLKLLLTMALPALRLRQGLLYPRKPGKPGECFAGVSIDILDGLAKLRLARDLQSHDIHKFSIR
jgi:hypothetical protein